MLTAGGGSVWVVNRENRSVVPGGVVREDSWRYDVDLFDRR